MMKSPGCIVVRSPSTAVYAHVPSTTKRNADCVCRWLGGTFEQKIEAVLRTWQHIDPEWAAGKTAELEPVLAIAH